LVPIRIRSGPVCVIPETRIRFEKDASAIGSGIGTGRGIVRRVGKATIGSRIGGSRIVKRGPDMLIQVLVRVPGIRTGPVNIRPGRGIQVGTGSVRRSSDFDMPVIISPARPGRVRRITGPPNPIPRGTSNSNYHEGPLNSTSKFPYRIGADRAEDTARARTVRFM